ncbi:MAG: nicotinate-nucleotide--dimethylbenzimidazole phosphoribosyltransferase [Rhodospirillaceae bacterium]
MISLPEFSPIDPALETTLRAQVDALAKPPGALGRMEGLAVRLGALRGQRTPLERALLLIFAGDHGLTEDGVSSYPSSVTALMVDTFLGGRASANAFARAVGADVRVVDAGVAADLPAHGALVAAKIRKGTRNAAREAALTAAETEAALDSGMALARSAADEGYDILAMGEMGIGNTASAALIMHRLTGIPLDRCVGRGAGHDDAGLARKLAVLERAAARSDVADAFDVLRQFGGLEIAMMAGTILGAAAARRVVMVDGFISTAAALAAVRMARAALPYCVFSHRSAESGHCLMLEALDAAPLLDLEMRLGEGTGALLAIPLVRAASRLLTDVASLEDVLKGKAK